MNWLYIAILAYFLYAVHSVIDKKILVGKIPNPVAYSFYFEGLSIFVLMFAPFVLAGLFAFMIDGQIKPETKIL